MTQQQQPRDVPPTRPVGEPVEGEVVGGEAGLGGAARLLADAVAGLLGRDTPTGRRGTGQPAAGARAAAGVLADVVAAVSAAARSAARPGGPTGSAKSTGQGRGPASGGVLSDLLDAAAPRLPIRDAARLRQAYPGASDAEIADALVARAARLTAGIGAAAGGLAAAQWFAAPSLVALPLELGAQTLLLAGVEVVLIGELHELAGRRPAGDARARAGAYLTSWTTQRAVGHPGSAGAFSMMSTAGVSLLRRHVTRRMARHSTSMAPLMLGATLAARLNRKATGVLADRLRADLGIERADRLS